MNQKESKIERDFVNQLNNGIAIKMRETGYPDRLVILPRGKTVFIEFKRPKKSLSEHQEIIYKKLRRLGHIPHRITSTEAALALCERIKNE